MSLKLQGNTNTSEAQAYATSFVQNEPKSTNSTHAGSGNQMGLRHSNMRKNSLIETPAKVRVTHFRNTVQRGKKHTPQLRCCSAPKGHYIPTQWGYPEKSCLDRGRRPHASPSKLSEHRAQRRRCTRAHVRLAAWHLTRCPLDAPGKEDGRLCPHQ